ncbi:MAG: hypothetical protein HY432_01510 [Candidatus Liptonbacteria bacterium]|nr:hypothetical protein [Candidatus Liptonbacteria bacterium]
MEKISITKKDSVPKIVEKILESRKKEIVLFISANSELKGSVPDFELIKREAETAGKKISVDSPDKDILETAEKAGIQTKLSPAEKEKKDSSHFISDILPLKKGDKEKAEIESKNSKPAKKLKIEENTPGESFWEKAREESIAKKRFAEEKEEAPVREHKEKKRFRFGMKKTTALILTVCVFVLGAGWAAGAFWGKAEVSLSFKKTPWHYEGTITASKTFSTVDTSKNNLPAEIFRQEKNMTRIFPASGRTQVSDKATARILIYNVYSSTKQTLVATTRFATPDGKIFRLDKQVVVPGAVTKDGKITPSSIEASVTADKAGTDYNIGPFEKLTIPGFKGTPRYEGFYGTMPQPAAGGFIGEKAVATDQDISLAKGKTEQSLKDTLQSGFLSGRPDGFNILDGASSIAITKLNANKTTDENGNFSVFGEASFQAIAFKDEHLKSLFESIASRDYQGKTFTDLKIDYKNVKADLNSGILTFIVVVDGTLEPRVSEDALKAEIAGKGLGEARAKVIGLPDLSNAKISLWPFWLIKLPANVNRIKVVWN